MLPKQFISWSKAVLLTALAAVLLLSGIVAQAQDDPRQPYLTWDNAPATRPLRNNGDAQVYWGWQTREKALGPFFQEPFQVGDRTQFIISEGFAPEFELFYRSDHAYFWFEVGTTINMDDLVTTATRFDAEIWELDRYLYGENASPGIDGDARIHIVHLKSLLPGLAGFFSPDDQCARALCAGSNERDVLYMILDYGPLNTDHYYSTLAHEFQHMIQFGVDGNEYRWLDEGLSQLAEHLHGFNENDINSSNIDAYLDGPNIRLDGWSLDYREQSAHYGAGYLLTVYLYERFGVEFIRELARNSLDGLASIHNTLQRTGQHMAVDDVILDWWIANTIDNPYVGDGRYYYQTLTLLQNRLNIKSLPVSDQESVTRGLLNQYGVAYYKITRPGHYTLHFNGDTETPLALIRPHSGNWMWWSYNASASATSLTRTIDLTSANKATLKYWLSGETGRFPGYLHILASVDGAYWDVLHGAHMDIFDYFSEAPGPHYSGLIDVWQADMIDLSNYAGQVIRVRFEYVTNNAVSGPGFMLDDISIPEIGWSDDMEVPDAAWEADGFLHTQEMVQQNWGLAVIANTAPPIVTRIPVANGQATATLDVPDNGAIIVLGPMAAFTPIEARYTLRLIPTTP